MDREPSSISTAACIDAIIFRNIGPKSVASTCSSRLLFQTSMNGSISGSRHTSKSSCGLRKGWKTSSKSLSLYVSELPPLVVSTLHVLQETPHFSPAVINGTSNGKKAYVTGDLAQRHPRNPKLWRIFGRADDQLTLTTGEKVLHFLGVSSASSPFIFS